MSETGFREVQAVAAAQVRQLRARKDFSPSDAPWVFPPEVPVDWQELTLVVEVDVHGQRVRGTATWEGHVRKAALRRLRFDAVGIDIPRAFAGSGEKLAVEHDGEVLWLTLPAEASRGDAIRVSIDFDARQPRAGFYFILPDADHPDRPAHAWTQGQDEDSKYWFPCHDAPNHKQRVHIIATVPGEMVALSNGALRNIYRAADADKRIYDWQISRPIPIYLLTLTVGPFVEVRQQEEPLPISYHVLPGREADGERAFGRTPEMVRLYERLTGVRYPFEKYDQVAVSEFVFGGMENASMTTQTDLTLHDERAHLDFSSEALVSHELAHQWFGDLVTCRSWAHGWLNEGFATYFEQLWKEHAEGPDEFDFNRLQAMRSYMAEDGGRYRRTVVTGRYQEPIDVFDAHLYEKGGAVLHMLRRKLGDATFYGAVRAYLEKHADGTTETPDLRRAFEDYSGAELGRFFQQWIEVGSGYPELKVQGSWDGETRQYKLTIEQTQDAAKSAQFALDIPLRFAFETEAPVEQTLVLTQKSQTWWLTLPAAPKLVLVDPRGDVLATWDLGLPEPMLKAILLESPDALVRVHAAAQLGKRPTPPALDALAAVLAAPAPWFVHAEAAKATARFGSRAALQVLIAAGELAHPKARRAVRDAIGKFQLAGAAEALAGWLAAGDASYLVEAETAKALGATRSPLAFDALTACLDRTSWNETIRVGILDGLALLQDARGIDVAAGYLAAHHPTLLRCAAIRSLCSYLTEPAKVLTVLGPWTADTSFRFAFNLASSLANLGDARAIGLLQQVADRAVDGRVRRRAQEGIAQVRGGLGAGSQVDALRGDVDGLKGQLRELAERLDKAVQQRKTAEAAGA